VSCCSRLLLDWLGVGAERCGHPASSAAIGLGLFDGERASATPARASVPVLRFSFRLDAMKTATRCSTGGRHHSTLVERNAPSLGAKHSSRNGQGPKLAGQARCLELAGIRSSSSFLFLQAQILSGGFPARQAGFGRSAVPLAWILFALQRWRRCSLGQGHQTGHGTTANFTKSLK